MAIMPSLVITLLVKLHPPCQPVVCLLGETLAAPWRQTLSVCEGLSEKLM